MEYYGPSDYYFWQGILEAQDASIMKLNSNMRFRSIDRNKTLIEANIAYEWGFLLGKELSKEEFSLLKEVL